MLPPRRLLRLCVVVAALWESSEFFLVSRFRCGAVNRKLSGDGYWKGSGRDSINFIPESFFAEFAILSAVSGVGLGVWDGAGWPVVSRGPFRYANCLGFFTFSSLALQPD